MNRYCSCPRREAIKKPALANPASGTGRMDGLPRKTGFPAHACPSRRSGSAERNWTFPTSKPKKYRGPLVRDLDPILRSSTPRRRPDRIFVPPRTGPRRVRAFSLVIPGEWGLTSFDFLGSAVTLSCFRHFSQLNFFHVFIVSSSYIYTILLLDLQ